MKNKSLPYFIIVLAPLVFSFAFALDIYIPSVPSLVSVFDTTAAMVQLTLSLYMLMMGVGQLVMGPLSDRFGRRPIALISSVLFLLASLSIVIAPNILSVILLRMLQAMGASGMMCVAFAMVRDCYHDDMSAKVLSYLNSTIAVSPLFAPLLGGYIAATWGWRTNFIVLSVLAAICVLSVLFMQQETHASHRRVAFDAAIFSRYWRLLLDRNVWPFLLASACGMSMFFCFFSISPFIIIDILHVPEQHFGYYFAILGVAFLLGSMISARLVNSFSPIYLLRVGASMAMLAGMTMYVLDQFFGVSLWTFLAPTLLAGVGAAFIVGNGAALVLEPYPEYAGTASALLGAGQFAGASLAASIMMLPQITSSIPYAITVIILALLIFLALVFRSK